MIFPFGAGRRRPSVRPAQNPVPASLVLSQISLPRNLIQLTDGRAGGAREYLLRRGFDPEYVGHRYDVTYCPYSNSPPPTIVHGDYRLDNTMLDHHDAGRIVAVLDWEMSTLGDPLADLGLFLLYWGRPEATLGSVGAPIPTDAGFFDRDTIVERYAAATGLDLHALDWYEIFASYKLAIILAGIHARYLMGMTRGDGFDHIGAMVGALAQGALDAASTSELPGLRG